MRVLGVLASSALAGVLASLMVFWSPGDYPIHPPAMIPAAIAALAVSPVLYLWARWVKRPKARDARIILTLTIQTIVGCLAIRVISEYVWLDISGYDEIFGLDVTWYMVATGILASVIWGGLLLGAVRGLARLSSYVAKAGPGTRLLVAMFVDAVIVIAVVALSGGLAESTGFVALAVGAVVAALCAFLWLPEWQLDRWEDELSPNEQAEHEGQARASVAQLLGGLGLIATLALTLFQVSEGRKSSDRTLVLTARGQINDRFSRAIDQLGAREGKKPAVERRLGGIYALQQFVLQSEGAGSPQDAASAYRTASVILSAYVRANRPRPRGKVRKRLSTAPLADCRAGRRTTLRPDIAAAIAVLRDLYPASDASARGYRRHGPRLDLANTNLSRADLRGLDLRGADLRNAKLVGAQLSDANLERAQVAGIDARGACFLRARLSLAHFTEGGTPPQRRRRAADLRGADLARAALYKTNFRFTDLRRASMDADFSFWTPHLNGARLDPEDERNIPLTERGPLASVP